MTFALSFNDNKYLMETVKKPGSAFSYVLPPKKRPRESQNENEQMYISAPNDIIVDSDGTISRSLLMSKPRYIFGLATELDVFLNGEQKVHPHYENVLNHKYGPMCKHIRECHNAKCQKCILSKVLANPTQCHRVMNHIARCNTNQCSSEVCAIFKNHMLFKFMMYNIIPNNTK
jgi:hypothetical protein